MLRRIILIGLACGVFGIFEIDAEAQVFRPRSKTGATRASAIAKKVDKPDKAIASPTTTVAATTAKQPTRTTVVTPTKAAVAKKPVKKSTKKQAAASEDDDVVVVDDDDDQ